MRKIIISLFFLLQVIGIVSSRFLKERYFSWAPFDQISQYEIEVKVQGIDLSQEEIRGRYNLPGKGRENRSIDNVFSIIRQFEETYGKEDAAVVKVTYRTNGKAQEEWGFVSE